MKLRKINYLDLLSLDHKCNLANTRSLYDNIHTKQRFDPQLQSITHQLKISIRSNKRNNSLILKFRKSDAGMEFHIFKLNSSRDRVVLP